MGMWMDMMARMGGHLVELEVLEYALDGMEGQERANAEEHLRRCSMCRKAVRGAMDLHDGLALAGAPVMPPAGLTERIIHNFRSRL